MASLASAVAAAEVGVARAQCAFGARAAQLGVLRSERVGALATARSMACAGVDEGVFVYLASMAAANHLYGT